MFQNFLLKSWGKRFNQVHMIFESESVQNFLMQEFNRRVRSNPRYSLRAYSQSLGMSSGALSEILRQQRPVSLKTAVKIAKSLGMNVAETNRLCELVEGERRNVVVQKIASGEADKDTKQLDEDTFHLVSEWHHFAILNLLDCDDFRWTASHIAKRLGLGIAQTQMAMDLLLRLGLVKKKGDRVVGAKDFVLSPNGISSTAIRKYHRQMLEKAIEALELQEIDERDITGIGFAIDPKRLPQIKNEISIFQDQLAAKFSYGKKREVYFLETALFRITKGERHEDN